MEMYLEGDSTRKVREVTEELCGTAFSKSTISRLTTALDSELEEWRQRPLEADSYPYLFVDARYEKVRIGSRIVSEGVLVVCAVREDGFREILAVEVADVESEATYQELFRALKERGLKGVELVTSDEHKGLKSAIERHFRGASHQRCQFHYAKNLLGLVSFAKRKELGAGLRAVSRPHQGTRSPIRRGAGQSVAWEQPEGGRAHRGAHRGVPGVPFVSREPP